MTRVRLFTLLAVGLCLRASFAQPGPPVITSPAYQGLGTQVAVPAFFEDRVIYYNSFDTPGGKAAINTEGIAEAPASPVAGGILGHAHDCAAGKAFTLTGDAISAHHPITYSVWWCLTEDTPIDGGLGILHVQGRGIISNFVRGKGEWCGLQKPCAVFQVYYFPGIGNVNGLYDGGIWDRGMLKAGVWHNTVLSISGGNSLGLYMDGQHVMQVETTGRPFSPEDGLRSVTFGGNQKMLVDEIMVLDRALLPWEIAAYGDIVRQMRAVGYVGK